MSAPHYKEIPDHWKYPMGPYRQAPPEFGGEWWVVNPFTTSEPWKVDRQRRELTKLPPGFLEIFGPRPRAVEFLDTPRPFDAFKAAEMRWEQDLKYFKGVGLPEWASESQQGAAEGIYQSWDMGSPKFYEGRYGHMARFPDSQMRDFETTAWAALNYPHHEVALYQIRLVAHGIESEKRHPYVPPHLWSDYTEIEKEVA